MGKHLRIIIATAARSLSHFHESLGMGRAVDPGVIDGESTTSAHGTVRELRQGYGQVLMAGPFTALCVEF